MVIRKQAILLPLLGVQLLLSPSAVWSQGISCAGGAYGSAAGLGAGLAASRNHGKMVVRSYEAMAKAQQALLAQTQTIQQYMKIGCQFEAAKQWENAEKSFKYVLQVVAVRDGPGSNKGVPALKHLVAVSKAENKLDQAITYQKTVLAFTRGNPVSDAVAVAQEHCNLSNLYVQYGDYQSAAPVLKEGVAYCQDHPSLPIKQRKDMRSSYAKVLRQLHRDSEADAIEIAGADETKTDGSLENPSIQQQSLQSAKPISILANSEKVNSTNGEQGPGYAKDPSSDLDLDLSKLPPLRNGKASKEPR